jgi:hypothetical protein
VRIERGGERRVVGKTERRGKHRPFARIDRHRVGLRVVAILQPMLERAQEVVRVGQPLAHVLADQPARLRMAQHRERRPHAELRVLAAADQLEHLRAEFDLADAAAPELDVVGLVGPHRRGARPRAGSADAANGSRRSRRNRDSGGRRTA